MAKYISRSFATEHSTAEKNITSPIIVKKDLIHVRWEDDISLEYKERQNCIPENKQELSFWSCISVPISVSFKLEAV